MAGDTAADLAYTHARESVAGQRARLDNLRTRATALITAASVIAAFLGAQALADTQEAGGKIVADRSLELWEAVAFGAFLGVLGLCAFIIAPRRKREARTATSLRAAREAKKGWTFRLNANAMLAEADNLAARRPELDADDIAQEYKRQLVGDMEGHYKDNEPSIERRFTALLIAISILGVEALAFLLDLVT